MSGGVLWPDVHHVLVFFKQDVLFLADFPVVGISLERGGCIQRFFAFQRYRVYFGVCIVVFT